MSATDFDGRARQSARAFRELAWPVLRPRFGGDMVSCEAAQDPGLARIMDQWTATDYWWIRGQQMMPVASRMLRAGRYSTFTVRVRRQGGGPCEYDRIRQAIAGGWLYPQLWVQGYYSPELWQLSLVLWARTADVLAAVAVGGRSRINPQDGTEFWSVPYTEVHGAQLARPGPQPETLL